MGKQKQRFALRQGQDKNPLIQQNKLAKGKNIASSSKQSDDRKLKIDRTRKYVKNSSKPDKSLPSKEVVSKNEDLETQEMLEDPRAFLLRHLHLNLQKIPNTENEKVNNIISESVKQSR
uniref:Ribosome biogenesis protein SLX9 n=1 Tax=Globodera pallida TaxID=36090 RepID=A0A183BQ31_GLOPA